MLQITYQVQNIEKTLVSPLFWSPPGVPKSSARLLVGVPKVSPKASEIKQKLKKISIDKPLLNCSRWKVDFYGSRMPKSLIKKTGFEVKIIIDEKIPNIQKH